MLVESSLQRGQGDHGIGKEERGNRFLLVYPVAGAHIQEVCLSTGKTTKAKGLRISPSPIDWVGGELKYLSCVGGLQ